MKRFSLIGAFTSGIICAAIAQVLINGSQSQAVQFDSGIRQPVWSVMRATWSDRAKFRDSQFGYELMTLHQEPFAVTKDDQGKDVVWFKSVRDFR